MVRFIWLGFENVIKLNFRDFLVFFLYITVVKNKEKIDLFWIIIKKMERIYEKGDIGYIILVIYIDNCLI